MNKFINIINKNNYQRNLTLINKLINEIGYLSFSKVLILSFLENIFDLLSIGLILSIIFADQNLILLNSQVSLNYKILFFIILISFKSLSKVKISILKNKIILELNKKISIQSFSSILYSPLEKVNKIGRGEAFSLLRNDVIKTINSITQFINFFQNFLTLIIFIFVFVYISNLPLPILFIIIITSILFSIFYRPNNWKLGIQLNEINRDIMKTFSDSISGFKMIKSTSSEDFFINRVNNYSSKLNLLSERLFINDSNINAYIEFLVAFLVILWVIIQKDKIDSQIIITSLLIAYKSVSAFSGVIKSYRMCITFLPGFNNLLYIRKNLPQFEDVLEKRNLIASYEIDKNELLMINSIKFRINKKVKKFFNIDLKLGELFVIVGESGCGKTTLLDHFCGLKNQSECEWIFNLKQKDNSQYNQIPSFIINKFISYATQQTFLFEGSLLENLSIGRDDYLLNQVEIIKEINYWLDYLGLMDISSRFISNQHEIKLLSDCFSGGEIQRLGIIRTFLSKKPIEVFDEPTSYLDDYWAEKVSQLLLKRSKDKIVLVSSHDKRIINKAKRIISAKDFLEF